MSAPGDRPLDAAAFARLMTPFGPFEQAPALAVAVSGGRDSLALALLAHDWARVRGGKIAGLIVDHGLRAESGAEAAATRDVLERMDRPDPLLDLAMQLEEIALADEFFVSRRLYPNVDFYTGLIYKAMGFPTKMFTVLFALGRLPGWIAQWREMIDDKQTKIGRPRQVYVGAPVRDYVDIEKR